jgi:Ring finger domain
VNKTDLVLGEENPDENDVEQGPPKENTDNSSGYLCLRLATGLNRIVPNCCAICLGPYEVVESVVWSSNPECLHCFHEECVTNWFIKMQDGSPCPCCRQAFTNIEDERNKTQIRWAPGSTMNISVITI